MSFTVLIPSRYDSTRLPGKPLADLNGKSLIQRVYEAAKLSDASSIFVATDSKKIEEECDSFGGRSILTKNSHQTGSDRLSEAATLLALDDDQIIINLQGDEPFIDHRDINALAEMALKTNADMITLYADLEAKDKNDKNVVKISIQNIDEAISFSRKFNGSLSAGVSTFRHLGIYAYKVSFLREFIKLSQSRNELLENLEQLRVLDNQGSIKAIKSLGSIHLGIDTQEDLNEARKILS